MAFFQYNDDTRSRFDLATQKQLNKLVQQFGHVELRELLQSKEWCVRITTEDDGDRLPLAALGDTPYEAAERLLRISQFRDDES